MDKILLFDLEQTLFPDWTEDHETLLPLLHPELRDWIFDQFPFRAGVFSWAIHDDRDKAIFNKKMRPSIEEHLHFKFEDDLIFSVHQIGTMIKVWEKMPFETSSETVQLFKKEGSIRHMWRNFFTEPNTHVILLDDTVDDSVTRRTSILGHANGHNTTSKPIDNSILELVNPWTIIRS